MHYFSGAPHCIWAVAKGGVLRAKRTPIFTVRTIKLYTLALSLTNVLTLHFLLGHLMSDAECNHIHRLSESGDETVKYSVHVRDPLCCTQAAVHQKPKYWTTIPVSL